ncbi:TetR/AcrR family transcriptional repressor of nem operon [Lipingzhangella halophila]|uniref:TetR/AcrR family transcriptional repressor of nem operon n=1 Tax=Lipingzhangella halophila TaxID=1783352 RepID=A0A7W7RNJ9_9ACTN|nr:TetR/AcrR family transcriptional regulator [Lipingzhangella halophila]MBB4935267.1 TetR/AcrR family transcriptional repressor of nem operon [Lipingzhangella halophila]
MARTKEFDPDAALGAALELFWERGYEATSMADLVDRLGVARASIYATFGGKRDLYLRALERYDELTSPGILQELSESGPALPAVRAFVERYAAESMGEERRRGCFMANTAVELAPHDDEAARRVRENWLTLETALTSALLRARAQGELASDADPYALARFLVVLLQGMRVTGKASEEPSRLRAATEQALRLLD